MRNPSEWSPSKFVLKGKNWKASKEVSVGSRLTADLAMGFYQKYAGKYLKGRLLDLGCGQAPFYGMYRQFVSDSILCDWENSYHSNPHLDVICDLTQTLPFGDNEFDSVLLSDVLEHIPNPGKLIGEIGRILRPGGVLLMNVPFIYPLHEEPYDYYRYTSHALRRLMEDSGLEVLHLDPLGGALESWVVLTAKQALKAGPVGVWVALFLQEASRYLRKMRGDIGKNSHVVYPLGYGVIARK
jgi:SAM-dependent methyltransferase